MYVLAMGKCQVRHTTWLLPPQMSDFNFANIDVSSFRLFERVFYLVNARKERLTVDFLGPAAQDRSTYVASPSGKETRFATATIFFCCRTICSALLTSHHRTLYSLPFLLSVLARRQSMSPDLNGPVARNASKVREKQHCCIFLVFFFPFCGMQEPAVSCGRVANPVAFFS